jgi:nitrogen fixation protein NifX
MARFLLEEGTLFKPVFLDIMMPGFVDPSVGGMRPARAGRRLTLLARSSTGSAMAGPASLRIAFASGDRLRVDQHFGSARAFVLYDVSGEGAAMSGIGEFPAEAMNGNEDKLAAKVEFLAGCDAVFVLAIGASAIGQLWARGVQPLRVLETDEIAALLREIAAAIVAGGVPWVERALAARRGRVDGDRFAAMEEAGWEG